MDDMLPFYTFYRSERESCYSPGRSPSMTATISCKRGSIWQSGREVVSNFDLLRVDKRQTLHPNARLTPKCLVDATVDERLVLKGLRRIKNKHRLASYEWYQLWQGKICLQFQISTHFFWGHFESDKNMILLWYEFVVMSKKRFLFCFFSFSRTAALVL